jgi:hypothetical protein
MARGARRARKTPRMSSPPLLLRKEAAADLVEAVEWYEARRGELGLEFLGSVRAALATVESSLERFPIIHGDIRRAPHTMLS